MQVSVGASQTRQDKTGRWESPGKWTKFICQGKLCKGRVKVF
jgi:hypothetical protein